MDKQNYKLVNEQEATTLVIDDPIGDVVMGTSTPRIEGLKILLPKGQTILALDPAQAEFINYNMAGLVVLPFGELSKTGEKNLKELKNAYADMVAAKYPKEASLEEENERLGKEVKPESKSKGKPKKKRKSRKKKSSKKKKSRKKKK